MKRIAFLTLFCTLLIACKLNSHVNIGDLDAGPTSDAGSNKLSIKVTTDLVPGIEFDRLEVELYDGDADPSEGTVRLRQFEANVSSTTSFARGIVVGAFDDIADGSYSIVVKAYKPNGVFVISNRFTFAKPPGDYEVSVFVTHDCLATECPGGGSQALNACLSGACVDPRCAQEKPEFCPADAFCTVDADCPVAAACAQRSCQSGVCIAAPVAGACAETEWCDPTPSTGGCKPL